MIPDELIDRWIREDVPSLDLTTHTLGIGLERGSLTYASREPILVCGTEEVARMFARLGLTVDRCHPSGTAVQPGAEILAGRGTAEALHQAWKVGVNILEHASGIATRTRRLVDTARAVRPGIGVAATRKSFPGTRDLAMKAIVAGGALPHRLGLSETFLAFEQHRVFCGGFPAFLQRLQAAKTRLPERKVLVEVNSLEEARQVARAGADGVQFDKVAPTELCPWVGALRTEFPGLVLIAAGGVNESNAKAYAATGVDVLATSSVYFGKPADIAATMQAEAP